MISKQLPKIILILPVVSLAAVCFGQKPTSRQKPDFTGTWVLEESQSNLDGAISDYVLTVIHREPEIRMTRQYRRGKKQITEKIVYYTDGKAEINPNRRPGDPTPETKWQGMKLVRRAVSRPAGSGSLHLEFITREQWSLSDDRQTLTRSLEMTMGSSLISKTKAVFKRSQ